MRPWHYYFDPAVASIPLPRYRCFALIDGAVREYTQASICPVSNAGEYLGMGLHIRSVLTERSPTGCNHTHDKDDA